MTKLECAARLLIAAVAWMAAWTGAEAQQASAEPPPPLFLAFITVDSVVDPRSRVVADLAQERLRKLAAGSGLIVVSRRNADAVEEQGYLGSWSHQLYREAAKIARATVVVHVAILADAPELSVRAVAHHHRPEPAPDTLPLFHGATAAVVADSLARYVLHVIVPWAADQEATARRTSVPSTGVASPPAIAIATLQHGPDPLTIAVADLTGTKLGQIAKGGELRVLLRREADAVVEQGYGYPGMGHADYREVAKLLRATVVVDLMALDDGPGLTVRAIAHYLSKAGPDTLPLFRGSAPAEIADALARHLRQATIPRAVREEAVAVRERTARPNPAP